MSDPTYVSYTDSLETLQPNESKITNEIVASMGRVNRLNFDKYRHGVRDAHAKSHGILRGELVVSGDLPVHLRQGIFAEPATYAVMARLSTAPGELQTDRIPSPRGMAIKILGIAGNKVLAADQSRNQDLLLVNSPTIPFGDVAAYLKFQQALEQLVEIGTGVKAPTVTSAAHAVTTSLTSAVESVLAAAKSVVLNPHILGETFHSMGALRFGDYVAKLSAAPLSPSVTALTGTVIPEGESILRDLVVDFFKTQSATYELRAQLLTNAKKMPIEDASVLWSEDLSPHQAIATLTFPAQDAYSNERRIYADDILTFNPWHCIEAHRPLGSIMRVRVQAYEASSSFRHQMNLQPRIEPKSIEELPD